MFGDTIGPTPDIVAAISESQKLDNFFSVISLDRSDYLFLLIQAPITIYFCKNWNLLPEPNISFKYTLGTRVHIIAMRKKFVLHLGVTIRRLGVQFERPSHQSATTQRTR